MRGKATLLKTEIDSVSRGRGIRSYSEEGATSEDAKDGSLSVNISGAVNTGIAGTYTMTYSAIDDGTTINVNGVEIEYVEPQTSLVTRTVVVEERHRHVGGRRSLNSATKTTPTIIVENQIAPSSKTISPNFSRNLSIGFTGEDVRTLQKYLNTHGFPVATSGVGSLDMETTYFGLLTKAALIRFQSSIGLPSTGFFGPMTQGYIKSH